MTAITNTLAPRVSTIADPKALVPFHVPVAYDRAANTTAYPARGVVSTAGAARAIEFENCASRKGGSGIIRRVTLTTEMIGIASYALLLFNAEPTNFTDNAVLALNSSDRRRMLGHFLLASPQQLAASSGSYSTGGQVGFTTESPLAFVCEESTASLWGLLIAASASTSVVSAAEFVVSLHGEQAIG